MEILKAIIKITSEIGTWIFRKTRSKKCLAQGMKKESLIKTFFFNHEIVEYKKRKFLNGV